MTAVLLVLSDHLCWRFGRCADNGRLSHCLHEVHYTAVSYATLSFSQRVAKILSNNLPIKSVLCFTNSYLIIIIVI